MRLHSATFVVFALVGVCYGQKPPAVIEDLRSCVTGLAGGMPANNTFGPVAQALSGNGNLLASALSRKGASVVLPPEYLANLNETVGICRSMLMSLVPGSPFAGVQSVADVDKFARDMAVKAAE